MGYGFAFVLHPLCILLATLFREGVFKGSLTRVGSPPRSSLIVLDTFLFQFWHRTGGNVRHQRPALAHRFCFQKQKIKLITDNRRPQREATEASSRAHILAKNRESIPLTTPPGLLKLRLFREVCIYIYIMYIYIYIFT